MARGRYYQKAIAFFSLITSRKKIRGKGNIFSRSKSAILWQCNIVIKGGGNRLKISPLVMLKKVTIFVQGDNNLIEIGDHVRMTGGELWVEDNGSSIVIGNNTTIVSAHLASTEGKSILIGHDCMFSSGIEVRTGDSHSILDLRTGDRINYAKDTVIGNHVWVAANVSILKGSNVGDGSIVGAKSLVTAGIYPKEVIIAGTPAGIVKKNVTWIREKYQENR